MSLLTEPIQTALHASVLGWLATVDSNGQPNVSPKEVFVPFGDTHVLIAHIASPNSVRNLQQQPLACLSFVDIFVQKGYKLQGRAEIIWPNDVRFATYLAPLLEITQGRFPVQAIIALQITATAPIVAPSYRLFPDLSVEARMQAAMQSYGVMPRSPTSA